jgi:hypothetical protein
VTARWWSQRFAAEGGAAAEGISKQLGRPALDPLTVLVREAAQNSWDARHEGTVEFTIELRPLGDAVEAWRSLLLPGPDDASLIDVDSALRPDQYVIRISDRNTRGLGGPLRADVKAPPGAVANFVQFLRNVGEPSDRAGGGGTYGFGKGSLFGVSRARTIIVDSHCVDGLEADRRLMGSSLGHSYYDGSSIRYTGRHWWGEIHDDVPDPLVGSAAEDAACALGLPGFDDGRTGTDIVILGADLGRVDIDDNDTRERTPAEAATFMMSAVLWNLWPKFGSDERTRDMDFRILLDGRELDVPHPAEDPYLAPFVASLDELHTGEGRVYERVREPKRVGELSYRLVPADPRGNRPVRLAVSAAMPFEPPFRHVARMRAAELVVDYMEGPSHADVSIGYAGVFRADSGDKVEHAFATSEPPTHDDWVERGLSGTDLGIVRGARKFIKDTIASEIAPRTGSGGGVSGLGALAAELAGLIPAAAGNAPSPDGRGRTGSGGGGTVGGRKDPHVKGDARVVLHEGSPHVVARVVVPPGTAPRRILASASVVLEGGGAETQPPLGAAQPAIVGWRRDSDQWQAPGSSIQVDATETSDFFVYATYIPDAVVRIAITTEEVS